MVVVLLLLLLLHRSRPHFIYTNFFSPRSRPYFIYTNFFSQRSRPHFIYTNFYSQLHWPGLSLHKLFWSLLCTRCYLDKLLLATPAPPIVSTQTFARNSCTPDSICTNVFSELHSSRFLVQELCLATPLHLVSVQQPRT